MPIKLFIGSKQEPMAFAERSKSEALTSTTITQVVAKKAPVEPVTACNKKNSSLNDFETLPDCGFVRQPEVEKLFGCSKATIWRWVKSGKIPKPVHLGGRVTAWNAGELRFALQNALMKREI